MLLPSSEWSARNQSLPLVIVYTSSQKATGNNGVVGPELKYQDLDIPLALPEFCLPGSVERRDASVLLSQTRNCHFCRDRVVSF